MCNAKNNNSKKGVFKRKNERRKQRGGERRRNREKLRERESATKTEEWEGERREEQTRSVLFESAGEGCRLKDGFSCEKDRKAEQREKEGRSSNKTRQSLNRVLR